MIKKIGILLLGLIVGVLICFFVINAKKFSNESDKQTSLIKREEVLINTENGIIYGIRNIPQNTKEKMPIVILAHGHGGTNKNCTDYEYLLSKNNLVTLSIDFRGGSSQSKSEGKTTDMTIFTEVEDLKNVIEEVKTWEFVDSKKIFLIGISQGGLVSAITAAEKENDVSGLILLAPGLDLKSKVSSIYEKNFENLSEPIEWWGIKAGKEFFSTIYNYDVYNNISKYKKEVLIIHGDKDNIAPIENSLEACNYYEAATLITIKGGNHLFDNIDTEEMNKEIVEFIKSKI